MTEATPSETIQSRLVQTRPPPAAGCYWNSDADVLLERLGLSRDGLTAAEAAQRLRDYGHNRVREQRPLTPISVLGNQRKNPPAADIGVCGGRVGAHRGVGGRSDRGGDRVHHRRDRLRTRI